MMNRDTDNVDSTDKSVEKVFDIMESSSEINVEQLREMPKDEEIPQVCRDIMDSSPFLRQKSGMELPNIEMELERFKKKQYTARIRSDFWKVSMGIAAMIAILLGTYYLINTLTTPVLESIVIFTTDAAPQHITLQKDSGEKTVLDKPQSNNQTLPQRMISKSEKKELDYRQVTSMTTQTHVLTVPHGESFKVVLCDGTEIWLNANSDSACPTAFIGDERTITLEDKAYFKVAKNPERPFIVKTKTMQTRVLGTEFNIRSYIPKDTHVVLINGKVEVSSTKGGSCTRLYSGEDAHLQSDGNFIPAEVDLDSYVYWKDGYFYFDNVILKDIMQNLGHWYNVNIESRNKEAMEYKIYFISDRTKDLEHTISLFNRMKKVIVTLQGNTLTVD